MIFWDIVGTSMSLNGRRVRGRELADEGGKKHGGGVIRSPWETVAWLKAVGRKVCNYCWTGQWLVMYRMGRERLCRLVRERVLLW